MSKRMRFYLAGPFFNPAQIALMEAIELAFCDADIPFFSPRQQAGNQVRKITDDVADHILSVNCEEIDACSHLLAVVDWKTPVGLEIRQLEKDTGVYSGPPLNIPDAGTMFELGYNFRWNRQFDKQAQAYRPQFLFTERPATDKLNLMISRSCDGVIHGLEALKLFLGRRRELDLSYAGPWIGGHS